MSGTSILSATTTIREVMTPRFGTLLTQGQLDTLLRPPICLGKDCGNSINSDCWYFCRQCGKHAMRDRKTVDKKTTFHASCAICDNGPPTRSGVCSSCMAVYPLFASTFLSRRMDYWWKQRKGVVNQSVFMRRWLGFEISDGDNLRIKTFLTMTVQEAVEWKRRQRVRKQRDHNRKRKLELDERKRRKQQIEMKELLETHAQASVDENDAALDVDRMCLSWNHVRDETDRQQWERDEIIRTIVRDRQSLLDVELRLDKMLQHDYEAQDSILLALHVLENTMRTDELVQNDRDLIFS